MANHVGSATASGSVAGSGSGAAGAGAGSGAVAQPGDGEGIAPFVSQVPGTPVSFPSYHGRPISWVAVGMIMLAFAIGGAALAAGPIWWLFWASLGLAVVGFLMCGAISIFDDWY